MTQAEPSPPTLRPLLSPAELEALVGRLATEVTEQYPEPGLVCVGVLTGAFIFLSDLVRRLPNRPRIDFIRVSSYGSERTSSGSVRLLHDIVGPIRDRHVLVVEDIVDTGMTARFLLDHLRSYTPKSVRLCSLLDKPSRRLVEFVPDFVGLAIPDRYVVGYGLDDDGQYRELPGLYEVVLTPP